MSLYMNEQREDRLASVHARLDALESKFADVTVRCDANASLREKLVKSNDSADRVIADLRARVAELEKRPTRKAANTALDCWLRCRVGRDRNHGSFNECLDAAMRETNAKPSQERGE